MDAKDIGKKLAEPFPLDAVGWKPQMVKNNRALAAAYIDARDVMNRLDATVGVGGWSDRYEVRENGSTICHLRVKVGDEWVEKCDVGSLSDQPDAGDALKAAFSDALKRAAVKFGIGRYLYRLPLEWHDYDPVKKKFVGQPPLPDWAVPKQLATPQQVYLMESLAVDVNLSTEEIGEWWAKAGAEEWADLTQEQIQKCIDRCKGRKKGGQK